MYRVSRLTAIALIGASCATAAGIQIGGGTNGVNGLTASYVGSQTGWVEKNYDIRLFGNLTENGSMISPPFVGGTYQELNGQTTPATLTDPTSGITFAMVSDSACTGSPCGSDNFMEGYGPNTLTIPVGVLDVQDAWTLMGNVWGTPGANDTTVTFDFGTSATGGITEVLTVALTNAGSSINGTPSGQISTVVECTTVGGSNCTNYAIGPTAPTSTISTTGSGSSLLPSITVLTDVVSSMAYNGGGAGGSQFMGSSGNVVLSDQGFEFGSAFSNLYLVNIKVAEASGAANTSETALSAITVVTPEPSTVWMLFAGFGAIGFASLRRKKA